MHYFGSFFEFYLNNYDLILNSLMNFLLDLYYYYLLYYYLDNLI